MKLNFTYHIWYLANLFSIYIPKEIRKIIKKFYLKTPLHPFCFLKKIILETELLENNVLLVKLNDGTKFYGPAEKPSSALKCRIYGLNELKKLDIFGFLYIIYYHYVENIYEKYYRIKEGDTVVDAGAHIGIFTVKAAKIVGKSGRVYAIEPEEKNLQFLRKNVEENKLENVVIINKGLWSKKGKLLLKLSDNTIGHSFYPLNENKQYNKIQEVETETLDNLCVGTKKVDFIRMNIEGAEVEALKGASRILEQKILNLAIEARHVIHGMPTYKIIIPHLEQKGFKIRMTKGIVYASK